MKRGAQGRGVWLGHTNRHKFCTLHQGRQDRYVTMQSNFSPRNIAANKVERVVPNALKDFRCGQSVLRPSRSTFDCIDTAKCDPAKG